MFLAKAINTLKFFFIVCIILSQNPFQWFAASTPNIYTWALQNKVRSCALFFSIYVKTKLCIWLMLNWITLCYRFMPPWCSFSWLVLLRDNLPQRALLKFISMVRGVHSKFFFSLVQLKMHSVEFVKDLNCVSLYGYIFSSFHASLIQLHIFLPDMPIWSKLESDRIPSLGELMEILNSHLRLSSNLRMSPI